ncbi:uncharacterized protein LOC133184584 [Saccostrea echinata]|uniref:uncharacterized protein LOC133184584 n=1 Tax=Saccostrea echinata TaxID=191078 RepID=UPI002A7FA8E1|nr:uncharacterized protein LOC133184584 [Saccostrea echinata]
MSEGKGATGKRYGPVNNPYYRTMRNILAYLKPERRVELKFHISNNPGPTFMMITSTLLVISFFPLMAQQRRIDFTSKAYHCHYRVLRREDADPKLKELGYYN